MRSQSLYHLICTCLLLKLLLALLYECSVVSELSYSQGGAKQRFEQKFLNSCSKYPFVSRYLEQMRHPRENYLIFVFHENGQRAHGGLGDRLAGMVTAIAHAIRTERTFLVMGDGAFEESFRPFYSPLTEFNASVSLEKAQMGAGEGVYTWSNWEWAKWNPEYSSNMTTLHCVNPKPQHSHCALDYRRSFEQYKVMKFYGNRCYLCRWMMKADEFGAFKELRRILGITSSADLFEIAGCLLRLAVWPTEKLWKALDQSLMEQFQHRGSAVTTQQVGFHFRCGDSSFASGRKHGFSRPNPECFYDPDIPWKGTSFSDDIAMDSPIDAATCGSKLLNSIKDQQLLRQTVEERTASEPLLAYIASDNSDSSKQINDTLQWKFTIKPPQACHMDLQKGAHCTLITSLHWFMLSLSDYIVMQV